MNPDELRAEILSRLSPEVLASQNTQTVADALSVGRTRIDPVEKLSSLGLASRFPSLSGLPGPLASEMVLQKIEGLADVLVATAGDTPEASGARLFGAQIKRQMVHLAGAGMAFGDPAMAVMFEQMRLLGALSQEEVDALHSVSRFDAPVSEIDVRRACWSDAGEWLL